MSSGPGCPKLGSGTRRAVVPADGALSAPAISCILLGKPSLLFSAPHPACGLSHPQHRDRFSQTSAWPARPVQATHPEGTGARQGRDAGIWTGEGGPYLLILICSQWASGEVHVISRQRGLAAGSAPQVHGQAVLDPSHQLWERTGVRCQVPPLSRLPSPLSHLHSLSPRLRCWPGVRESRDPREWEGPNEI